MHKWILLKISFILLISFNSARASERIISLDLCMDWMVAHHVSPNKVAALSPFHKLYSSTWIDANWPSHNGSLEEIYSLKPDTILVGQYAAGLLRNRLIQLGLNVKVYALPLTLKQVQEYERQFLNDVQLPLSLAKEIPISLEKPKRKQTLLLLGSNGVGTGRNTLEHDILTHAGWENYLTDNGYITLDLEKITHHPPDAIMWSAPEHNALANQFSEHHVLKKLVPENRWLTTEYWRWQCPGPWMWNLIGQLNTWLEY